MPKNRRRRGFSLIELLIVIAIILILAMIAVPKVSQQLMSARETAAIQEIKTIHQAETQYYSTFGKYAESLAALGPPASGTAGPAAADLIPKGLSEGKNGGYIYTVAGSPTGYSVNANPEAFGNSGRRTFFSDQTLVIRNNWSQEPANVNSPELGSQAAATTATK
jgi:prepilin-type N-terminal cleavage/methylation domain-containing protein